ncbi:Ntc20p LALA0_S04e03180g [Lachancea lanzarotensis]|uniref:LALA0S04e03180g1_1 n=1 Tax=Lachancea lanzarotensis TaxID=1245769 RepID=A0A0C7N5N5_9SACH|nr:uncharacterized protein LALA0_S04e03180g [Lachancea lanzarotensis]CEP61898.1 LALA0S04e03180g1_1 [Lachancea lanzarotensis]
MASLNEQFEERKKRLQLLARKTCGDGSRQNHTGAGDRVPEGEEHEAKKLKLDAQISGSSPSFEAKPVADDIDDVVETEVTVEHFTVKKPTSDLEAKLRPDLDELERRTNQAIQRLVRQRYFGITQDNDNKDDKA